jgi:hypothetical protein
MVYGMQETTAGVAQLAEHNVANVVVVGSNPITRSSYCGAPQAGLIFRQSCNVAAERQIRALSNLLSSIHNSLIQTVSRSA